MCLLNEDNIPSGNAEWRQHALSNYNNTLNTELEKIHIFTARTLKDISCNIFKMEEIFDTLSPWKAFYSDNVRLNLGKKRNIEMFAALFPASDMDCTIEFPHKIPAATLKQWLPVENCVLAGKRFATRGWHTVSVFDRDESGNVKYVNYKYSLASFMKVLCEMDDRFEKCGIKVAHNCAVADGRAHFKGEAKIQELLQKAISENWSKSDLHKNCTNKEYTACLQYAGFKDYFSSRGRKQHKEHKNKLVFSSIEELNTYCKENDLTAARKCQLKKQSGL